MNVRQMTLGSGAGDDRTSAPDVSSFASKVLSLLERVEYRRCDKGEDLEEIYRLRYKAYRSNDMVPDDERHAISDDLDDAPNAYRFGIYIDQRLVSHDAHSPRHFPTSAVAFDQGVRRRRAADAGRGAHLRLHPSRFASDPEWSRVYPQLPYVTLRLAGMACFYFKASYCLSTIREDHAGFYRRIYCSEQIGEPRPYPGVFNKVVLFRTNAYAESGALPGALSLLQVDADGTAHAVRGAGRRRTCAADHPADRQIFPVAPPDGVSRASDVKRRSGFGNMVRGFGDVSRRRQWRLISKGNPT